MDGRWREPGEGCAVKLLCHGYGLADPVFRQDTRGEILRQPFGDDPVTCRAQVAVGQKKVRRFLETDKRLRDIYMR